MAVSKTRSGGAGTGSSAKTSRKTTGARAPINDNGRRPTRAEGYGQRSRRPPTVYAQRAAGRGDGHSDLPIRSASARGDAIERKFEEPLSKAGFYGYTVEHVFPIGMDPDMHGAHYIVVGMAKGRDPNMPDWMGDYATWEGIDWSGHPKAEARGQGCVIGEGHYSMSEEEAFRDALERMAAEKRRYRWDPIRSPSRRASR